MQTRGIEEIASELTASAASHADNRYVIGALGCALAFLPEGSRPQYFQRLSRQHIDVSDRVTVALLTQLGEVWPCHWLLCPSSRELFSMMREWGRRERGR